MLTYQEGLGNAEAAAVLDTSVSGVETLLVRAKRALRAALGSDIIRRSRMTDDHELEAALRRVMAAGSARDDAAASASCAGSSRAAAAAEARASPGGRPR